MPTDNNKSIARVKRTSNFTRKHIPAAVTPQHRVPSPASDPCRTQAIGKQGASLLSLTSASRRYIARKKLRKPIKSPTRSGVCPGLPGQAWRGTTQSASLAECDASDFGQIYPRDEMRTTA